MESILGPLVSDPKALAVTLAILLPGFIWVRTERRYISERRLSWGEQLLQFTVYSIGNYLFWWAVLPLPTLLDQVLDVPATGSSVVVFVFVLFLSPVIAGMITGKLGSVDAFGAFSAFLGFAATIDPLAPTGWDKAFRGSRAKLVRVYLNQKVNGETQMVGLLASKSSASIESGERDLYLEVRLCESEDGKLKPELNSAGVWISRDQISCVVLYDWSGNNIRRCKNVWQHGASISKRVRQSIRRGGAERN